MFIDPPTIMVFTFALTLMIVTVSAAFTFVAIQLKKRSVQEHWHKGMINEYERYLNELSGNLHNNVQQQLIHIKHLIDLLKFSDVAKDGQQTRHISSVVEQLNAELTRINKSMNLDYLRSQTLARLIEQDLIVAKSQSAIVEYHIDWLPEPDFSFKTKLLLYRIVQEAIENICKHALASSVYVTLMRKGKKLILSIEDDGMGLNEEKIYGPPTHGFTNMRSRAATLNAVLSINSEPELGTLVTIEMRDVA